MINDAPREEDVEAQLVVEDSDTLLEGHALVVLARQVPTARKPHDGLQVEEVPLVRLLLGEGVGERVVAVTEQRLFPLLFAAMGGGVVVVAVTGCSASAKVVVIVRGHEGAGVEKATRFCH